RRVEENSDGPEDNNGCNSHGYFTGFRLTFSQIADVGISGIIIDVLTLSSTFLLACFLGQKVFGLDKHTSW
ncbi:putative sulfate exporter family transporter, partial [Escherichia sp. HC-CC]